MTDNTQPSLGHPRHWGTWCLVSVGWLIAQLPWDTLLKLGQGIGHLVWWVGGTRKAVTQTNIRLCFPELSADEQQALAKRTLISAGEALTETIGAYFNRRAKLDERVDVEGVHHIETSLANGHGVILLGMHFNTIDVASRLVANVMRLNAVYRPNNNPVIDWVILRGRSRNTEGYIDRKDTRGMVRKLRQGRIIWYAPDQFYGTDNAVFAPFFGVPTMTLTATSRLAAMGRAAVIPCSHFRLHGGRYRICFGAPLQNFPGNDGIQDTARINAAIEHEVRKFPEQYLWVHRRFKVMPDGSNPYGKHVKKRRRKKAS